MSAHQILASLNKANLRSASLPEFRPGDSVKVWAKIREGEKTRLQAFEGVCIRRVSNGARSTFTVRKISYGVGVERIFPDHSPNIEKVDVVSRGKVHQSRLYYLRDLMLFRVVNSLGKRDLAVIVETATARYSSSASPSTARAPSLSNEISPV